MPSFSKKLLFFIFSVKKPLLIVKNMDFLFYLYWRTNFVQWRRPANFSASLYYALDIASNIRCNI